MRIGELAETLSVSTKTLRHYEKIGLIPEPERRENGYRVYSPAVVERAGKIVALRRLNLPLEAIRTLLNPGEEDVLRSRLLGILDEQRSDMSQEIAVLQGRLEDLDLRFMTLFRTSPGKPGSCICAILNQPCNCAETVQE